MPYSQAFLRFPIVSISLLRCFLVFVDIFLILLPWHFELIKSLLTILFLKQVRKLPYPLFQTSCFFNPSLTIIFLLTPTVNQVPKNVKTKNPGFGTATPNSSNSRKSFVSYIFLTIIS